MDSETAKIAEALGCWYDSGIGYERWRSKSCRSLLLPQGYTVDKDRFSDWLNSPEGHEAVRDRVLEVLRERRWGYELRGWPTTEGWQHGMAIGPITYDAIDALMTSSYFIESANGNPWIWTAALLWLQENK